MNMYSVINPYLVKTLFIDGSVSFSVYLQKLITIHMQFNLSITFFAFLTIIVIMATDEDLPQIEVEAVVADTKQTGNCTCDVKEKQSHSSMKYVPFSSRGLRRPSLRAKIWQAHLSSMHEGKV